MKSWVVMVDEYRYEVEAETKGDAMALAHRLFAKEHDNSSPQKGRVQSCEEKQ